MNDDTPQPQPPDNRSSLALRLLGIRRRPGKLLKVGLTRWGWLLVILVLGIWGWVRAANHEWRETERGSHDGGAH